METLLRIFGNFQQNNWSELLPVVQYQLNSYVLNITKQVPYNTWISFVPQVHQPV